MWKVLAKPSEGTKRGHESPVRWIGLKIVLEVPAFISNYY